MNQQVEFVNSATATLVKQNASDIDVARAAWVSNYGEDAREKDAGKITGLIKYLYNNKHMSPFEHGSFTFWIDCPIFVAREFHRHRTMSYNEISGRYTTLNPRFYVPRQERPLIQQGKVGAYTFTPGSDEQYALTRHHIEQNSKDSWRRYELLKLDGIANEVARDVLPVNIMTQFYATVNPRNLMQFLTLRDDVHALDEIRILAAQMDALFKDAMPITHAAYRAGRDDYSNADAWKKMYEDQKAEVELLRKQIVEQARNPVYNVTIDASNFESDQMIADRILAKLARNRRG